MIIDFHTHVFPEAIADRAIGALEKNSNTTAFNRGTVAELEASMRTAGIDKSVCLSVMTKPTQFDTINNTAIELNKKDNLIAFGSIHPACKDICAKLDYIKSVGLKGIKLHPDYHNTWMDDEAYVTITEEAIKRELIVLYHCGWDIGFPDIHHSSIDHAVNLLNLINIDEKSDAMLVLAHTGGWMNWDEVEEHLVGRNVYFDTSLSMPLLKEDQMLSIIRNHGCDRILFGTDSPWSDTRDALNLIRGLDLDKEELSLILGGNAARLLKLN